MVLSFTSIFIVIRLSSRVGRWHCRPAGRFRCSQPWAISRRYFFLYLRTVCVSLLLAEDIHRFRPIHLMDYHILKPGISVAVIIITGFHGMQMLMAHPLQADILWQIDNVSLSLSQHTDPLLANMEQPPNEHCTAQDNRECSIMNIINLNNYARKMNIFEIYPE